MDPVETEGDTEDLAERARALRRSGLSTAQIAARLGVAHNGTLAAWLIGTPPPGWTARPRAKDAERAQARALRTEGATVPEIARTLGVARSSAWRWVADLPRPAGISDVAARRVAERRADRRAQTAAAHGAERLAAAAGVGPLSDRDLMLVGVTAWWAEGSKSRPWRRSECVRFANSDPDMIRLFLRWLDLLGVEEHRRRFTVAIHERADVAAAERFWADVTEGRGAFSRPTLKRHNPTTTRHNTGSDYVGCLHVRVRSSAELYRRAEGAWWGIVAGGNARRGDPTPDQGSITCLPGAHLQRFRRGLSRVV
jgi:transposase-like protein